MQLQTVALNSSLLILFAYRPVIFLKMSPEQTHGSNMKDASENSFQEYRNCTFQTT